MDLHCRSDHHYCIHVGHSALLWLALSTHIYTYTVPKKEWYPQKNTQLSSSDPLIALPLFFLSFFLSFPSTPHTYFMRLHFISLVAMATVVIGHPIQQPFMSPERHGEIWSLCDDPSSHLLRAYEDGVYISPATPHAGQDINVRINGNLCKCIMNVSVVDTY